MKQTMTLVAAMLLLALTSASAAEIGWNLRKDKHDIQVYSRPYAGSQYDAIRATTIVRGRLSSIVALLEDPQYVPKLNKVISRVELQQRLAPHTTLLYLQMDLPWPVRDRDILTRRVISQNAKNNVVRVEDTATREILAEKDGFIRVTQSTQVWTLTPLEGGRVMVEWITHTDPNGSLPASVVNWLSVGVPFETLEMLRQMIEAGEFHDVQIGFINEPA